MLTKCLVMMRCSDFGFDEIMPGELKVWFQGNFFSLRMFDIASSQLRYSQSKYFR